MIAFLTFVKSPLFKYLMIALAVVGFLFGIFYAGEQRIQKKWDKERSERKVQIEIQRVVQDKITTLTNTVYVDKVKVIKEKGEKIYVEVPKYITVQDNANCTIPASFVWLHDHAVTNTVPESTEKPDGEAGEVSLTEATETIVANYGQCNQYIEQINGLQEWITQQKKANP